jgi:SAM-dependent methyltransferase
VSTQEALRTLYRSEDTYQRYSGRNPVTLKRLRRVFEAERRSFGRTVLDLCCGGGALALTLTGSHRRYTGVDANPDMIREAHRIAVADGSSATFVEGDVRQVKLKGRFDTITLLGNALTHLTTVDLLAVLHNLEGHLKQSAWFIVDYRDTVQLFFDRQGHGTFTQRRGGHRWVSKVRGVDLTRGVIRVGIRKDGGRRVFSHSQAIWSPFVLEPIMATQGWKLSRRTADPTSHGWRDVYQFDGTKSR